MSAYHPIFLILCLFALASCSSLPKLSQEKQAPKKVKYSKETQKSFEEIEREMLLQRYKRMRVEDGILQERPGHDYRPEPRGLPPKSYEPPLARPGPSQKPKQLKPKPRKAQAPSKVQVNPKEQRREIEQNLTYFCMKMRDDSRFASGESCEDYTRSVERECLGKFSEGELALTRCVKSQL